MKNGAAYTGRQEVPLSRMLRGGEYGIVDTSGALWQQHRRFAIQVFRDFGMGKDMMQNRILEEVSDFLKKCKQSADDPLDLRNHIDMAVGSIINVLLFRFRFDESNMEIFLRRKAALARGHELNAKPLLLMWMLFPWLRALPFFWKVNKDMEESKDLVFGMFDEQISDHRAKIDFDRKESSDYVEAYLKEQRLHEHEPDCGGFSNNQLRKVCFDLWLAGMETTSNTLYWGILYILLDSGVQKAIHDELDIKIGSDRLITMADRSKLHYMNAAITEIQRLANLLPMNVLHETTCDVEIEGYSIPKGTLVLPQISTVMYDEEVFPRPYDFNPRRHLAADGTFVKIEQVIPFSLGKRQCLGEGIARMELFLFLANFFNTFEIAMDGDRIPTTRKTFSGIVRAQDFRVVLKERH